MNENVGSRGDLTDDEKSRLAEINSQIQDARSFLKDVLRGWNHGAKEEYRAVEEAAAAVDAVGEATTKLT